MRTVTLALTHFNRFHYLLECVAAVMDDPRISEIIISDDASTDDSCSRLVDHFGYSERVKIFRNETNLDCYRNKHAAVKRATSEWVILFDDDNILPTEYLDAIFAIDPWFTNTAYCPVEARPHFDYRAFAGEYVYGSKAAAFMRRPHFATALNTANYFFNRDEWLRVWDPSVNPNTSDAIYQNLNWLKSGNRIFFVPGMWYSHRIHDGSHYKKNVHKTGQFAEDVLNKLKALK